MTAEASKRESRLRDGVENLHGDVVDAFYPKGNEGLADDLDAYLDASAEDRETLKTALALLRDVLNMSPGEVEDMHIRIELFFIERGNS